MSLLIVLVALSCVDVGCRRWHRISGDRWGSLGVSGARWGGFAQKTFYASPRGEVVGQRFDVVATRHIDFCPQPVEQTGLASEGHRRRGEDGWVRLGCSDAAVVVLLKRSARLRTEGVDQR